MQIDKRLIDKGIILVSIIISILFNSFSYILLIRTFNNFIFNPFKPEFTIVIFIHYKPRIAVAILDLQWMKMI